MSRHAPVRAPPLCKQPGAGCWSRTLASLAAYANEQASQSAERSKERSKPRPARPITEQGTPSLMG